uniref:Transport permease protein n=1 Tax=uncultured bacterium AB_162 TaxID=1630011 RepID=A0A0E3JRL2_9BACT|nr:ABC transporter, permease protein [uncultured bacterium AB_162]
MTATALASPAGGTVRSFVALLRRDIRVVGRAKGAFVVRTIMQPALLIFVLTYVFPEVGQPVGGEANAERYSALVVPGVVGLAIVMQGIQAVALPLVQEFGFTMEIEDRTLAPLPLRLVALAKVMSGAAQSAIAACVVFPLAYVIPATSVELRVDWPVLLTILPLSCVIAGALGLWVGTRFDPVRVPLFFSIIVVPLTFLGAVFYGWRQLDAIVWLRDLVLLNPLVFITEGLRAALTETPHMPLPAIYSAGMLFAVLLMWAGIRGFERRVVA